VDSPAAVADRVDASYRPPFPAPEYDRRLAATRRAMTERGIDLLPVADPANIDRLTGYDARSRYVPRLLLVETDDASHRLGPATGPNSLREWRSI